MLKYFDEFYMSDDKNILLDRCVEISDLLRNAYWAKDRDTSTMRNAIANSLNYAIFETNSKRIVGFARVITDFATSFYLCDVFIDENFRGLGLGKTLVEWIILYEEKLSNINGLLKTRDAKSLYEKYCFEECEAICMTLKRN